LLLTIGRYLCINLADFLSPSLYHTLSEDTPQKDMPRWARRAQYYIV